MEHFDPLSFAAGAASGVGVSLITWLSRRRLASLRSSVASQVENTRELVGQAADVRYARDLVRYLQQRHIAGDLFQLTDVLLEPRLIAPPAPVLPPGNEDVALRNVFDVVPMFHDLPQSYAPFNIQTMTLDDLGSGDRHVAILGPSGMGKSTALTTLALMALRVVKFERLEDLTEQAIREEESSLSDDERKQRIEERRRIQERALERLHTTREQQKEETGIVETDQLPALDIAALVPVLVHLGDIELDETLYGKKKGEPLDPAEPLVRAVQRQVSAVTARMVGSVIYPALEKGRALILIDGYDELAPAAREQYFYWLQQLLSLYESNMTVMAGPATGYESLVTLGFTPAFLRAWRNEDFDRLAMHWGDAWTRQHETQPLDSQAMHVLTVDNQGRSVLEVTLKMWTALASDAQEAGRAGWYDALVRRHLPDSVDLEAAAVLAVRVMEAGQPVHYAALQESLVQAVANAGDNKKFKPEGVVDSLSKAGLLVAYAGDKVGFPHAQLTNYLASRTLTDSERAVELAQAPAWQEAIGFAAGRINLLPIIVRKLGTVPDLLYSDLFDLVHWLPDAPLDAPWRGDLFKRLAAALMAPDQYPAVRERAVAALVASRDKNVFFVLRQALRATDPDIRRLGCVGLGALGNPEAVNDLAALLADENPVVKLAAALSLGALGSPKAIEIMVHGLFQEGPEIQRAIAEALAAVPGEGHQILRDAIVAQEIELRRAAVFGLSRVPASWSLIALYRAMLEDEQWYVRTAAEEAFLAAQSPEKDGPRHHPEADMLGWLVKWAADRGEGVPAGSNARQVLVRVLQEGQPVYKVMAAATLARLGHVTALKPLYGALRDRDAGVRSAAYRALFDLQIRLGQPLPGLL